MTAGRVLAISGSPRRGSVNHAPPRAAPSLAPPDVELPLPLPHAIPLFDGDVEAQGLPPSVVDFREAIRAADGVLVSTPEYNNSMPGVLKNAIDGPSRGKAQPLARKPLALLSASNGGFGGARSQIAWLPVLAVLGTRWMHRPQFYLSNAQHAFAPDGSLLDEHTREQLRKLLESFAAWCRTPAPV